MGLKQFALSCKFGKFAQQQSHHCGIETEDDVMILDAVFGQAAYGNQRTVIRLDLLPNWEALSEHIKEVQRGVVAAYAKAKHTLGGDKDGRTALSKKPLFA